MKELWTKQIIDNWLLLIITLDDAIKASIAEPRVLHVFENVLNNFARLCAFLTIRLCSSEISISW